MFVITVFVLDNFDELNWDMSVKIHFLDWHLNFLPRELWRRNDKQGKRFHQEVPILETHYWEKIEH